jgi:hypothetical protein
MKNESLSILFEPKMQTGIHMVSNLLTFDINKNFIDNTLSFEIQKFFFAQQPKHITT